MFSKLNSLSQYKISMVSSIASYPPNHRCHNVRNSNDEAEEDVIMKMIMMIITLTAKRYGLNQF